LSSLIRPTAAANKLEEKVSRKPPIGSHSTSLSTMAAVSAADIAPDAFNDGPDVSAEAADMSYDLRNLVVFNPHAVDAALLTAQRDEREAQLAEKARIGVQQLMNKLFALPTEPSDVGPVAQLPREETTAVPREKPLPKPRAETKWEKFAKEKGIQNKKSSRMVWDDDHKEWRPNWGYKRANDGVLDQPIVEMKAGKDPMADPWSEARAAKKARLQKNLTQKVKNDMRSQVQTHSRHTLTRLKTRDWPVIALQLIFPLCDSSMLQCCV
jgi:regulator of ribosome biosynthesis